MDESGVQSDLLWLGRRGQLLSVDGVKRVLRWGGAGRMVPVHDYRVRRVFAHDWKDLILGDGDTPARAHDGRDRTFL